MIKFIECSSWEEPLFDTRGWKPGTHSQLVRVGGLRGKLNFWLRTSVTSIGAQLVMAKEPR